MSRGVGGGRRVIGKAATLSGCLSRGWSRDGEACVSEVVPDDD